MIRWIPPLYRESTQALRIYCLQKAFVNVIETNDMKRRTLLGGSILLSIPFAGCLSESQDESGEDESDDGENVNREGTEETEYEKCGGRTIIVEELPESAKEEAVAAIENGEYETADRLLLAELIDISDAYLLYWNDNAKKYYTAHIEELDATTILRLKETLPKTNPVSVSNRLDEDVTLDISIKHNGGGLVDKRTKVKANDSVRINGDVEYQYGQYQATVFVEELELSADFSWEISETKSAGIEIYNRNDSDPEIGAVEDQADPNFCTWNEKGELTSGPEAT